MGKYASKMVELAQSWVGIKEGSAGHKEILDIYNSQNPLPRGYKMTTRDAWCAATTTALAVKLGYTDIVPCECSCTRLIAIAKDMGIWVENESITPTPGMLCIYDWSDNSGNADNKGDPDHIGIVESVGGGQFVVIEGNYDNAVKRRTLTVNGKYLRGFIAPKYDAEDIAGDEPVKGDCTVQLRTLRKGCEGDDVNVLQILLIEYGNKYDFDCGRYGADGDFGSDTEKAVRKFQAAFGLEVDGIVGTNTWSKLLGIS